MRTNMIISYERLLMLPPSSRWRAAQRLVVTANLMLGLVASVVLVG